MNQIEILKENYIAEREAALQYRALAEREPDPKRKKILYKLVAQEEAHADRWAKRLQELGSEAVEPNAFTLKWKEFLMSNLDFDSVLRRLENDEETAERSYAKMLDYSIDPELRRELEFVKQEEATHGKIVRALYDPDVQYHTRETRSKLAGLLGRERWHIKSGNWIGDVIYGANDGLGAVFGIVSGVAGATDVAGGASSSLVLVAGFAGMIASAVSMGSSAYLAAKSEREVYDGELRREREELEQNPEEEIEELSLMYQLRGFNEQEAELMAKKLAQQPEDFLRVKAAEELGLAEGSFPNPWVSLASGGVSTAIGAFLPLIPFFFASGMTAVILSFVISLIAHFVVGAAKSIITDRSWWRSGSEMMIVGVIVAVVTYSLGLLFQVNL